MSLSQDSRCHRPNKRKISDDCEHEAIEDWNHERFPLVHWDRGAFPIKKRRSYYFRTYQERVSRHLAKPPLPPTDDADIRALTDELRCLRLGITLQSLPDEILCRIVEYLAPEPVAIGLHTNTSLRDRLGDSSDKWGNFFGDRANITNLCLVNARFNSIASSFLYRNIFLSRPASLIQLLRSTIRTPSLQRQVRHLNCDINFNSDSTREEMMNEYRRNGVVDKSSLIVSGGTGYAWKKFFRLLSRLNRLESLGLFHAKPSRSTGRPGSWLWFTDEENPFADCFIQDRLFDMRWPPAFLRDVTIDTGEEEQARSFIHINVVPRADVADHRRILDRSGFEVDDLVNLLKPAAIHSLQASDHLDLRSYLDGLKRIPEIDNANVELHDHIDNLMSLTYHPDPTASEFDRVAARELAHTLRLLTTAFSTRLLTRSKHLAFGLNDFVDVPTTVRPIDSAISMTNVESLEIRDSGHFDEELIRRSRGSLQWALLKQETPFSRLKRLRLLLRVPRPVTTTIYDRIGRLRNLSRLSRLEELTITMEGLFGSTRNLGQLFGGANFAEADDGKDDDNDPRDFVETEALEDIVSGLPGHLETLRIVDWYHEYSEPARLLPIRIGDVDEAEEPRSGRKGDDICDQDCVQRLSALQHAMMAALSKLAPVLKAHSRVKKVVFWVHKWNVPDGDDVWSNWSQAPAETADSTEAEASPTRTKKKGAQKQKTKSTSNLRKLKREYKDLGLTLRVVVDKGDQEPPRKGRPRPRCLAEV